MYKYSYVCACVCIIKRVFEVYWTKKKRKKEGPACVCDFLAVRYYFGELSNSGRVFSGGTGFSAAARGAVVVGRSGASTYIGPCACVRAPEDSVNEDAHAQSELMYIVCYDRMEAPTRPDYFIHDNNNNNMYARDTAALRAGTSWGLASSPHQQVTKSSRRRLVDRVRDGGGVRIRGSARQNDFINEPPGTRVLNERSNRRPLVVARALRHPVADRYPGQSRRRRPRTADQQPSPSCICVFRS